MKGIKVWLKQNLSSLPNWNRFHMGGRFTDDAMLHLALVLPSLQIASKVEITWLSMENLMWKPGDVADRPW